MHAAATHAAAAHAAAAHARVRHMSTHARGRPPLADHRGVEPRADHITIRPERARDAFGVDVLFRGAEAVARAEAVVRRLTEHGVRATAGPRDGGWAVAFGPVTRTTMVLACPGVVW